MKKLALLLATVATLLLVAAPSFALEPPAQEYKEKVEPICQANKAKEEVLRSARKEVKEGNLKKASRDVFAGAKALKQTRLKLLAVPKPPEDAALLTKWLNGVKTEVELLEATGRKLANEEKNAAQKLVVRLDSNARKTNNLVLEYEFHYCRFNPSKFL